MCLFVYARFILPILLTTSFFFVVFKAVLLNEDEDMSTVYYRMKIEKSLKNGIPSHFCDISVFTQVH